MTARGENLEAIRRDGLQLSGAWGEHRARVAAAERLGSTPDLALVCAKAQDAEPAIRANATHLEEIPVVIVQNGLDGVAAARSRPRAAVYNVLVNGADVVVDVTPPSVA